MPNLIPVVVEGARIVARQATSSLSSTISSSLASSATTPLPTSTPTTSTTPTTDPNPTSTNGAGSGGGSGGGGGGGGGNNSSPLLFFVALGFGVVFTNLWIIVGVKYCFRYNARNRQLRMADDGEPINMENMPRPHRRRREKKLMTMDEVNEKFPMIKYKAWVSGRAQEGLPTRGGVSAPASRANSIMDVEAISREVMPSATAEQDSRDADPVETTVTKEKPTPSTENAQGESKDKTSTAAPPGEAAAAADPVSLRVSNGRASTEAVGRTSHDAEDEYEEDDHIDAALPPECVGTSGDTCAICIDTLEDDDDVRGLTCGHAFHAVCLDPWLTSRRACCPLCKADYYTPKPRPAAAEQSDATGVMNVSLSDPRVNRGNMPSRPRNSFFGLARSRRQSAATVDTGPGPASPARGIGGMLDRLRRPPNDGQNTPHAPTGPNTTPMAPSPASPSTPSRQQPGGMLGNLRSGFGLRTPRRSTGPTPTQPGTPVVSGAANPTVTPSDLEAGRLA